jgi:hypothetical protein
MKTAPATQVSTHQYRPLAGWPSSGRGPLYYLLSHSHFTDAVVMAGPGRLVSHDDRVAGLRSELVEHSVIFAGTYDGI